MNEKWKTVEFYRKHINRACNINHRVSDRTYWGFTVLLPLTYAVLCSVKPVNIEIKNIVQNAPDKEDISVLN